MGLESESESASVYVNKPLNGQPSIRGQNPMYQLHRLFHMHTCTLKSLTRGHFVSR